MVHEAAPGVIVSPEKTGGLMRFRWLSSLFAGLALVCAALAGRPASAQTSAAPDRLADLSDLYRRVSLDLDAQYDEAYRTWQAFEAAYMPDNIPFPLTGRDAKRNEDDIREYLSELRKARKAHVNNATVAGRLDDWPAMMTRWALVNARLSIKRLWEIKLFESQHAFGLLARDAAVQFEAAKAERARILKDIETAEDRQGALASLAQAEATRARVLETRVRLILSNMAQWRIRLAGRTWRWHRFVEEAFGPVAAAPFHNMAYGSFGLDLTARKADPVDPVFARDVPTMSLMDWLTGLQNRQEVLNLTVLDGETGTRDLTVDLHAGFAPVETLDPARRSGPARASAGSAAERLAVSITRTVEALRASRERSDTAMFRMLSALDDQAIPQDLLDDSKAHLSALIDAAERAGVPVQYAAQADAVRAEYAALEDSLARAQTADPVDEDRVADLKADLISRGSILERLTRSADKAREALFADVALMAAWSERRETNERLHKAWQGLGHAQLAGVLDDWPAVLPELDGEAANILVDLEEAIRGLTRFLGSALPVSDGEDAGGARARLAREDALQLALVRRLAVLRDKALALLGADGEVPISENGTAFGAAMRHFDQRLSGASAPAGETPFPAVDVPSAQVRTLTLRLAALQRLGTSGQRAGASVAPPAAGAAPLAELLDRVAQAQRAGFAVAGMGAVLLDDRAVLMLKAPLERLRGTLRDAPEAQGDGPRATLALIRALEQRALRGPAGRTR